MLRSRLELQAFLMLSSLILTIKVPMPILPLIVVLILEKWVDGALMDRGP